MNSWRIYVRDTFVGKAKGRTPEKAINAFISDCGFDCLEEYASEAYCEPGEVCAKRDGVWC